MSKYNTNKNKYLAKSERASVPKITKNKKEALRLKPHLRFRCFFSQTLCLIWMIEIQSIKIGVKQVAYSVC